MKITPNPKPLAWPPGGGCARYFASTVGWGLVLGLLLVAPGLVLAQAPFGGRYGNEWINYNQTYVKLEVSADGLYRLRASDPEASSNGLTGVDPSQFKLYYRGQEQPLYIYNGGNPNRFDGDDFLEFMGRRNDGEVDRWLYRDRLSKKLDTTEITNEHQSLFTDVSSYYLTWSSGPGLRVQQAPNPTFSGPPSPFCRYTSLVHFGYQAHPLSSNFYNMGGGGAFNGIHRINSDYIGGEGYMSRPFDDPTTVSLQASAAYPFSNTPPQLRFKVFGVSSLNLHRLRVRLGRSQQEFQYEGVSLNQFSLNVQQGDVNPNTSVSFTPLGQVGNTPDNNALCWVALDYDRQFDFPGNDAAEFYLVQGGARENLRLTGFNLFGQDSLILYNLTSRRRVIARNSGGAQEAVVPKQGTGPNRIWVSTGAEVRKPQVKPVQFRNLTSAGVQAPFLIITHPAFATSAQAYKTYRDTNTVNRIPATVVYTDEIYDEFGFGSITPLAIRRFCLWALQRWSTPPEYVLLWGKGRYDLRFYSNEDLLPTWNNPATDYIYVSGFDTSSADLTPRVPIGRFNFFTNQQGLDYLAKVDEYEHQGWEPWMKNAVHLGGGTSLSEQQRISNILQNNLEPYWEGYPMGGKVFYQQKTSSTPVDASEGQLINEVISDGATMLTFFGHSSAYVFDVDIEPAYNYTNYGRYPFILANGCYSGDFASQTTFGERFMWEPRRGSIGWLSSTSTGFILPMNAYSEFFYENAFGDTLGKPVGRIIQQTIQEWEAISPGNPEIINHCRQICLQGDPAISLHHPDGPDLEVQEGYAAFDPEDWNAQTDSMEIRLYVENLGRSLQPDDSFTVAVRQINLGSGQVVEHGPYLRSLMGFSDTLSLRVLREGRNWTGLNRFDIFVDAEDTLDEMDETNNRVSVEQFVPSLAPAVIYPWEYAVINAPNISLQAATISGGASGQLTYYFEIDTSHLFNSSLKAESGPVQGSSTLGEWQLPFSLQDSTVYYWRVRLGEAEPSIWTTASFQYIQGEAQGWAQARPPQFLDSPHEGVEMDEQSLNWQFEPLKKLIQLRLDAQFNPGFLILTLPGTQEASLNAGAASAGLLYCVIDGNRLEAQTFTPGLGDMALAAPGNAAQELEQVINNMRCGDYLALITVNNRNDFGSWPASTFNALNTIGASNSLRNLQQGQFFLLLGQKCSATGSAAEVVAPNAPNNEYLLRKEVYAAGVSGLARTPRIGPALAWRDLIWNWDEQPGTDDRIQVNVQNPNSGGGPLLGPLNAGAYGLGGISPSSTPYLELNAPMSDSASRTPPDLTHWYVLYDPAPEACLDPNIAYEFESDTVQEGQEIFLRLAARNLTNTPMDSLIVQFQINRLGGESVQLDTIQLPPLGPFGSHTFTYRTSTQGMVGDNLLRVELNPGLIQPERYAFNNIFIQEFHVQGDRVNPVLDVTFDGRRIQDGDIVSANPNVLIQADDENLVYPMDDTTNLEVYFKNTETDEPAQRIFYSGNQLQFQPASLPENKAQVTFLPGPLPDGEYQLEVQSFDQSGNPSGDQRYIIRFKVVNERTVTRVFNYPNPFSTNTRFVYTLTGDQPPEIFQIHIYSISGRLIKVIDLKELGEAVVGNHITSYAWDGTDTYGDKLATGVYLYRVLLKMPGETTLRQVDTDGTEQYFSKGFGKMVIMR